MHDKNVIVFGSPWVGCVSLAAGAKQVYVVNSQKNTLNHEQMHVSTLEEFCRNFSTGSLPDFEVALSFHFISEYGLGIEGEKLNPWADMILSQQIRCAISNKTESAFILALPFHNYQDALIWNQYRIYGKNRYPLVLANWKMSRMYPNGNYPISVSYILP
jgi:hypothetical protein